MVNFTVVSSVVDDTNLELMGVTDLEIVTIGSAYFLFAAAEADGAISSFRITANFAPLLVDTVSYSATSGTFAVSDLTIAYVEGALTLIPSARYDDNAATYHIDSSGNISTPVAQSGGGTGPQLTASEAVVVSGNTYLFASERGQPGLVSYWMRPTDSFNNRVIYSATEFNFFGDISAFASITIGADTYLFTASAFDAGLNSFRVGQNGVLSFQDSVAPTDASGFHLPQVLETISVSGQDYLIMRRQHQQPDGICNWGEWCFKRSGPYHRQYQYTL